MSATRRLALGICAVATGFVASFAAATPAQAVPLGGVNVSAYCSSQGWGDQLLVDRNSVWGWRCVRNSVIRPMDMTAACRWTYSSGSAYARYSNPRDPASWHCYV